MIIGGDFNLPGIRWGETVSIKDQPSYGYEVNNRFVDVCEILGLTQIVKEPTRNGNTLDLFLVTSPDRCEDINILPGVSDHEGVSIVYKQHISRNKKPPRNVYIFKRADMDAIKHELHNYRNQQFQDHCKEGDVNYTWEKLKITLQTIMDKYIPQRTIRQNTKLPWVNTAIRRLGRRRGRARKKAKTTGAEKDWNRYHKMTKEMKQKLKDAHH